MIDERAFELGRLIGQSEEYKALRRAHERVKETPELQERMNRLQEAATTIEGEAAEGREPGAEMVSMYNTLLSEIQGDSQYQSVMAAQSNFDKLMVKVNEKILDGIRKGAASPIITLG